MSNINIYAMFKCLYLCEKPPWYLGLCLLQENKWRKKKLDNSYKKHIFPVPFHKSETFPIFSNKTSWKCIPVRYANKQYLSIAFLPHFYGGLALA